MDGTIRPLRQVGLLVNNPCHIKYILVMGRRAEVENNEARMRRLRVVAGNASDQRGAAGRYDQAQGRRHHYMTFGKLKLDAVLPKILNY